MTTLIVMGIALMLGLTISSVSVSQLHLFNSDIQGKRALAAAEAALALAIEELVQDENYGSDASSESTIEVEVEGGSGLLTFSNAMATERGIPRSTSNRANDSPVDGHGETTIPSQSVQLLAVGEAGGKRRVIEAILQVPDFPFALASSGPLISEGGLLVGGVETLEEAFEGLQSGDLNPADLASNAPGESVLLQGKAEISGNIKAVGQVTLGDGVLLRGEVEQGSDPVSISNIELEDLRPAYSAPLVATASPVITDARHMTQPQVTISNGLTLDGGVLYVNGDLTIHGGVRGEGALLVNGSVTIHDGAALAAENQVALMASDDVIIHGGGQHDSFFQGLIYTEGDLVAQDITLLGAFVANRESSSVNPGSRLVMNNAGVIHMGSNASFETVLRIPGTGSSRRTWFGDNDDKAVPDPNEIRAGTGRFRGLTHAEREEYANWVESTSHGGTGQSVGGTISTQSTGGTEVSYRIDLNEFLNRTARTRILSWRLL